MTSDRLGTPWGVIDTLHEEVPMTIFAGIDWGGHFHQAAWVDAEGVLLANERFSHDSAGLRQLRRQLHEVGDLCPVAVERA